MTPSVRAPTNFPVRLIRLGWCVPVLVAALLDYLGESPPTTD